MTPCVIVPQRQISIKLSKCYTYAQFLSVCWQRLNVGLQCATIIRLQLLVVHLTCWVNWPCAYFQHCHASETMLLYSRVTGEHPCHQAGGDCDWKSSVGTLNAFAFWKQLLQLLKTCNLLCKYLTVEIKSACFWEWGSYGNSVCSTSALESYFFLLMLDLFNSH